jgi:hypothetical protein
VSFSITWVIMHFYSIKSLWVATLSVYAQPNLKKNFFVGDWAKKYF